MYTSLHNGGVRYIRYTVKPLFALLQGALCYDDIKEKFSREEILYFQGGYVK